MVGMLLVLALFGEVTQDQIVKYAMASRRERAQKIAEHREKSNRAASPLERPDLPYYARQSTINLESGEVGQIGWLDSPNIRVVDIVDGDNVIASYRWQVEIRKPYLSARRGHSEPGVYNDHERGLWLRGISTKNLATDQRLKLAGAYAITGTESYDADTGQITVPVLEPVDIGEREHLFTRQHEARTWVLSDGRSVEAIYCGYARGAVELLLMDGKKMRVNLRAIDGKSRDHVLEQNAKRRQSK